MHRRVQREGFARARTADPLTHGVAFSAPAETTRNPVMQGFLDPGKPTRGLEPRTPSLRVTAKEGNQSPPVPPGPSKQAKVGDSEGARSRRERRRVRLVFGRCRGVCKSVRLRCYSTSALLTPGMTGPPSFDDVDDVRTMRGRAVRKRLPRRPDSERAVRWPLRLPTRVSVGEPYCCVDDGAEDDDADGHREGHPDPVAPIHPVVHGFPFPVELRLSGQLGLLRHGGGKADRETTRTTRNS